MLFAILNGDPEAVRAALSVLTETETGRKRRLVTKQYHFCAKCGQEADLPLGFRRCADCASKRGWYRFCAMCGASINDGEETKQWLCRTDRQASLALSRRG